jgi:hypothetical protein
VFSSFIAIDKKVIGVFVRFRAPLQILNPEMSDDERSDTIKAILEKNQKKNNSGFRF